ncbi:MULTISPECIES: iron chaperone [unclassified Agrococcus]|uniref:iron chaperone n=1 Tax=unclassified Agrococcus TaxID=2615065 RepID=UPI003612261C
MTEPPPDVAAYLDGVPLEVADRLRQVRAIALAVVPDAEERVRYGIPAVMLGGRYAIHYAGWKAHVGLYPVPVLDDALEAEVAPLRKGKDGVVLRHRDPLPTDLISRIVAAIVAMRTAG